MNGFRRACYGLALLDLLVLAAHLFWPHAEWGQGRSSYFDLGNSLTLGSWLIAFQLLVAAALAMVGFHREGWREGGLSLPPSGPRHGWPVAALACLLYSLVEITRPHDRLELFEDGPEFVLYSRLTLAPLGLVVLALAAIGVVRRLPAAARPWGYGWATAWGYALILRTVAPAFPESTQHVVDLGTGAGVLLGCTLLLLALGTANLRLAESFAAAETASVAPPWPAANRRVLLLLGVGGTTLGIIFLQIVLFQLLTIFADYITANTVLSIALLGISLGGLIGFFASARAPLAVMIVAGLAFPFMVLVAFGATVSMMEWPLVASLLLTLPFACGSCVITVALARAESHLVYCIDLLGAALGAFLVNRALSGLREESSLLLLCAFLVLVAGCFVLCHPARAVRLRLAPLFIASFVVFAAAGLLNLDRDWLNVVRTHMLGSYPEGEILFSRSSFVGRYDIIRTAPQNTSLKSVENGRVIDTIRSRTYEQYQIDPRLPHTLMDDPRILIIGISGDAITKTARWISDDIVGIEINPAVAELQANELRPYNGNSYEGIEVVAMDGRTYAERSQRQFDMITLLNTHFAKGYVTDRAASAEYLQTVEAMRTYLRVLTDRGIVIIEEPIGRPYRETPVWKLLATMRQALVEEGSAEPHRHFFIFQWKSERNNYYQILMKKTPFTEEDLANLRLWLHQCDTLDELEAAAGARLGPIKAISTVLYAPDLVFETTVGRVVEGRADDDLIRAYNLRPTTDDRPFPFDVDPGRGETKRAYNRVLLLSLGLLPFFAGFLVRYRTAMRLAVPYVAVVALTGMAYLLVEIALIQRYAIFIGSPVATFAAVLGSLLIASGLGSLWSGRIGPRGLRVALVALALTVVLQVTVVSRVFHAAAGLESAGRVLVAVLLLVPLGFFMGVPFPFVLRAGKERLENASAAMLFAINAATSALAVPLALNLSSAFGLDSVLFVALVLYAAVAACLLGALRPQGLAVANAAAYLLLALLLVSPWLISRPVVTRPGADPRWDLYAVSMGTSSHREDRVFHGGSPRGRVPFEWLFWVARAGDRVVLIDTGFNDAEMARQWAIRDFVRPAAKLAALGIAPADVSAVVLTHLHWDHAGDVARYTRAKFYVQRLEYEHMRATLADGRESASGFRVEDLRALEQVEAEGRLVLTEGEEAIAPGLTATLGGAHTAGFQHVTVRTLDGPVIIAGDATYQYWNNQRHIPIGTSTDPAANLAAIRDMQRLAASPFLILPGHDPRVMRWFPEVADKIVQVVMDPS